VSWSPAAAFLNWPSTRKWRWGIAAAAILLLLLFAVRSSYIAFSPLPLDESSRMKECRESVLAQVHPSVIDLQILGSIHSLCYSEESEEDVLSEFSIRRLAYLSQQRELPVLMWLVVAITLSGVVLSALQLFAAYQLALAGKESFQQGQGGDIGLEKGKLSLRSSVTGLLMLIISLLFFYVFVTKVYLIQDTPPLPGVSTGNAAAPSSDASAAGAFGMAPGGLGPPPTNSTSN
jgi:hypothetical protein